MELLTCDKPKTPSLQPNNRSPSNKTAAQRNVRLSSSNTLKPIIQSQHTPSNNRMTKTSNLSKSDEFEQIENLINDQYRKTDKIENKNAEREMNSNDRKYSDDFTSIDPSLINENDNLSIPDNLIIDNYSPAELDLYSVQYDNKISSSESTTFPKIISNHADDSFDDIDFDELMSALNDDCDEMLLVLGTKSELNNCSSGLSQSPGIETKKLLVPIKRSLSMSNPVVKARSMKNKQDIQDYLHGTTASGDLFTQDHDIYEEYKKYEQQYLKEKAQAVKPTDKSPSPISATAFGKPSGDSAYGRYF